MLTILSFVFVNTLLKKVRVYVIDLLLNLDKQNIDLLRPQKQVSTSQQNLIIDKFTNNFFTKTKQKLASNLSIKVYLRLF